jgi:hypothetical protein
VPVRVLAVIVAPAFMAVVEVVRVRPGVLVYVTQRAMTV